MIYKRCGRCGKRIPSGTNCECYQKEKRMYAKAEGIKKAYHTQRWKNLREYVLVKYNGIDIYMLYKYGKVVPADTVHHIATTKECPALFYSVENLIPVSRRAHEEIHERYKREDQETVQKELRQYLKKFLNTGGG